jgi:HAD superfamily hydrolase (TIGR01662 family)
MAVVGGVIFDLGSTLIRFRGEWTEVLHQGRMALAHWLRHAGYEVEIEPFAEAIQRAFEANFRERRHDHRERAAREIVLEVLPDFGIAELREEDLREGLRRLYEPSEACWSAVPGVHTVLAELAGRGLQLGLLSNASDADNVARLMARSGLSGIFDPVRISAAVGVRKPTASLFLDVVQAWGLSPEQAVMVGDLLGEDILGAQRAGLHQIWVRAEADPRFNDEFVGVVVPERTAESIHDVPAILADLAA